MATAVLRRAHRGGAPGPELVHANEIYPGRLRQPHRGLALGCKELIKLMAQLIVTAAFLIEERGTLGNRQIERGDEQLLDALHARAGPAWVFASPPARRHGAP